MRHYIALIHKDANSDYGVSFPDLPGVISAGSTWTKHVPWQPRLWPCISKAWPKMARPFQSLPLSKRSWLLPRTRTVSPFSSTHLPLKLKAPRFFQNEKKVPVSPKNDTAPPVTFHLFSLKSLGGSACK